MSKDGTVRVSPGATPLAAFDLAAGRFAVLPLDEQQPDAALGQFRVGDTCYQIVEHVEPGGPIGGEVPEEDPTQLLTARELQIVRLICFGQVNKQIAYRLQISEYTVKTYLKQIFMKLNVHSRAAMVYRCARWVGAGGRLQ